MILPTKNSIFFYPLFSFSRKFPVPTEILHVWEEDEMMCKLHIHSDLGICLSFDQDVYNALSFVCRENEDICYRDIARFLKICPQSWGTKIKNSIDRLSSCQYAIYVYENEKQKTQKFKLLEKKGKRINFVHRPPIDKDLYVNLATGMTRRLYQVLELYRAINSYSRSRLRLREKMLCSIFPMQDRHATKRRQRINDISENLIEAGYLRDYFFDRREKVCIFEFSGVF